MVFCVAILFSSCRKTILGETENCMENIEKINVSLQTYMADPSVANCKNYVNALRSYLNANACFGNIFFEEYKEALKELEDDECN